MEWVGPPHRPIHTSIIALRDGGAHLQCVGWPAQTILDLELEKRETEQTRGDRDQPG